MASNALKTLFTNIASAIRETLPDEPSMKPYDYPDKIREVASVGGGSGSGNVEYLVRNVTFMSWDGSEELFKKPTIAGDDCVNVVSKGFIDAPTKPSTNTQNFTYSGWSTTVGGSADSNALKNITEDRTVYAAFSASVRYYTVTYMDETATLKTVQVTYGANASEYVPEKEGYTFKGWNPSVDSVTSDITTYATWEIDQGWLIPMESVETMPTSYVRFRSMCYSPDGTKLFVGDGSGKVTMYNATTKPYTKITTVTVSSSGINCMTVSPDGSTLVVGISYSNASLSNNVNVYGISATGLTKKTYTSGLQYDGNTRTPKSLTFNHDGTRLAISDSYVFIYDTSTTTWSFLKTVKPIKINTSNRAKYSHDGTKLYYSALSQTGRKVEVFDVANDYANVSDTYLGTSTTNGPSGDYGDIDVTKDGKYVVFGFRNASGSQSVTRYDTSSTPYGHKVIAMSGIVGNVYDLSVSPDGTMVAVASDVAPYLHVYDLASGTRLDDPRVQPTKACCSCAFSPDGEALAVGTASGGTPIMLVYQVKR